MRSRYRQLESRCEDVQSTIIKLLALKRTTGELHIPRDIHVSHAVP